MSDHPRISKEAEAIIDAVIRASGEDIGDAMYNLHRYIEKLEKRRQRTTND